MDAVNTSSAPVISIVLNAHTPFTGQLRQANSCPEQVFFEAVSETYIPLLAVFDRLDRDRVPFKMGISLSPVLCHMLSDEGLIARYLEYTDKQIEFGSRLLAALSEDDELRAPVRFFYDSIVEKRILFTGRYEGNILKVLDYYQRKGRLELLASAATGAFLPFYTSYPEAVQAQIEVAVGTYRTRFGKYPQGFWLPEMGWTEELDYWLRSYNFAYTMVDTHGLVLGRPLAEKGTFFPARTASGVFILGRDFYAREDLKSMRTDPLYRDNRKDLGFELPAELLVPFLDPQGGRAATGYKCRKIEDGSYDPAAAELKAKEQAEVFLDSRCRRLGEAAVRLGASPFCLCAFEADSLGRRWYEGPSFLEALFRQAEGRVQFMSPADYLFRLDSCDFQTLIPEFSSWGDNGYAETWVDSSNDWMYRHIMRALERMTEIAERFPETSGLKERILNQAAREILLLLSSDWPKMLYKQESAEYARSQVESFLRSFTTIYEALGSNSISTEWLTRLEKQHNIFPEINYHIFRRKKKNGLQGRDQ